MDVALIRLDELGMVVTSKQFSRRPSSVRPRPFTTLEYAGFGSGRPRLVSAASRAVATTNSIQYTGTNSGLLGFWSITSRNVQGGDSGGPLFRRINGLERESIGLISESYPGGSSFADLTAPLMSAWIRSQSVVSHTAEWRARHGIGVDVELWYGETEYVGPTRTQDDVDGDHWTDLHDNCIGVANPLQLDTDNDGIGDACEGACPNDPLDIDEDDDGVCAVATDGKPADNCPTIANADQKNCNELSERTLGKPVLGDACDPVPCPRVTAVDGDIGYIERICRQRVGYEVCSTAQQNDTFHLEPQGPGQGPVAFANAVPARGFLVADVPTSMHFCKPSESPRVECGSPDAIRDDAVTYQRSFDERVTTARPWVTASRRSAVASSAAAVALEYGAGSPSIQWDFFADARRWSSQRWIPQPSGSACLANKEEAGKCLGGVIAFHAQTEIGKTVRILPSGVDVGLHGGVYGEGRDLSNTFEPVLPIDNAFSLHWFGVAPVDPLAELRRDPRLAGVLIRAAADPLPGPQYRARREWAVEPAHYVALLDFDVDIAVTHLGPTLQQRIEAKAAGKDVVFAPELLSGRTLLSPGLAKYVQTSSAEPATTRWVHSHEPFSSYGGDVALVLAPTAGGSVHPVSVRTSSRGTFALAEELGEASTFADPDKYGIKTRWLESPRAQFLFLPTVGALFAVEAGHLAQYRAGSVENAEVELYAEHTQSVLRSAAYVSSRDHKVANLWVIREQKALLHLARYGWTEPLRGSNGSWDGGPSKLVELGESDLRDRDSGRLLPSAVQGDGAVFLLSSGDDQLLVLRNLDGKWRISALEGNGVDTPFSSTTWTELDGQIVSEPVLDASGLHLTVAPRAPAPGTPALGARSVSLQPIFSGQRLVGLAP